MIRINIKKDIAKVFLYFCKTGDKQLEKMKNKRKRSIETVSKCKKFLKRNNIDYDKFEENLSSKNDMNLRDLAKLALEYIKEALFPNKSNNFTITGRILILLLFTLVASLNFYLESLIVPLLAPFVGINLANLLASATVAPLVEETYKLVTIKLGQPEFGFVAISFAEAFGYISRVYKRVNVVELIGFSLFRLFGTLFHLLTMRTMMDSRVKSMKKKFSLAVMMHACINLFETFFLNIFSQNPIIQVLGDLTFTSQLMVWANKKLNDWREKEATEDEVSYGSEPIPQPA